mgnify:CR=1 FL=1
MAGGIDWFRWHHGTVTDQKFPLIAKRSGASVAEVIAVWACLLEAASMNENERGLIASEPDFESMDCALGMADGRAEAIFHAMTDRGLVDEHRQVTAWPKRQPKREREDNTAAERKRSQREREAMAGVTDDDEPEEAKSRSVTPCHATSHQKTPRGEERREENKELSEQPAQSSQPVSCAAEICRALRVAGVTAVQSQHPMLLALVDAGATLTEFVDAVPSAAGKRDAFAYLLSVVKGRRDDAARDAQALARGNFAAQGPPRQADRKHRQLATAAVLTGQTPTPNQPIRNLHPEAIDVESRILAP